jgi:hypothetical protein
MRCRELNEEWEQIIKSVQKVPGFEHFLQPKKISALKQAAVSGPIVILTASSSTCCSLIVTSTKEVQCLKLPHISLQWITILADLFRALSSPAFDFDTFLEAHKSRKYPQDRSDVLGRLFGTREGHINVDPDDVFRSFLALLWERIVKPVLDALNLQVSTRFLVFEISPHLIVEIL